MLSAPYDKRMMQKIGAPGESEEDVNCSVKCKIYQMRVK